MRRTQAQIREEEVFYKVYQEDDKWYGYWTCQGCGKEIQRTAPKKCILIRNLRKGIYGACCAFLGERNSFFGQKHSPETKATVSASRTGKATGVGNSMAKEENRKKVGDALRQVWASGKLDDKKEKARRIMYRTIAEGKLVTKPTSNEEKIFNDVLVLHGLKTKSQFVINTWRYDFLVEDTNIIIEYHGDFWHCNPKKYAPDYFNKKKNQYAHEIWAHDADKKKLAEDRGYRLISVWASDFKKNKENCINNLLNEINN